MSIKKLTNSFRKHNYDPILISFELLTQNLLSLLTYVHISELMFVFKIMNNYIDRSDILEPMILDISTKVLTKLLRNNYTSMNVINITANNYIDPIFNPQSTCFFLRLDAFLKPCENCIRYLNTNSPVINNLFLFSYIQIFLCICI